MATETKKWNRNIHYHRALTDLAFGTRALDVGCGGGMLTRQLSLRCTSVVGIDPHEPSITAARTESLEKNVSFVVGDVMSYPLELGSFGLVVSVAALHHMDAEAGLRRMADLLSPDGKLGVVGIGRSSYPRDLPRDALAGIATQVYQRVNNVTAWDHSAPMVWPPPLTDHQMKELSQRVLPGSTFRRRLHGRHTITWIKP